MSRPAVRLGSVLLMLAACMGADCDKQPEVVKGTRTVLVDAMVIEPGDVDDAIRATAAVDALRTSILSAEVANRSAALLQSAKTRLLSLRQEKKNAEASRDLA